eukprot:2760757-Alexandrium_andersonii.AAC.1
MSVRSNPPEYVSRICQSESLTFGVVGCRLFDVRALEMHAVFDFGGFNGCSPFLMCIARECAVSYTHLTLPTICSV